MKSDTEQAEHKIATAANDAVKVIADAAAEAIKVTTKKDDSDHDMIVRLDTKMDSIKCDIQDLKDGTAHRIETLEKEKLNAADSYPVLYKEGVEKILADHENRIRVNTNRLVVIMTVGSAVMVILGIIEWLISNFVKYKF